MDSLKSSGFWARARDWFAGVDALMLVTIFVSVPAAILLTYLYDRHDSGMSFDSESWGQLGDFLGGVLNPFVALLTVLILIRTIKQNQDVINISKEELLASRKALDATLEELKVSRSIQAQTEAALKDQVAVAKAAADFQLLNNLLMNYEERIKLLSSTIAFEKKELEKVKVSISKHKLDLSSKVRNGQSGDIPPLEDKIANEKKWLRSINIELIMMRTSLILAEATERKYSSFLRSMQNLSSALTKGRLTRLPMLLHPRNNFRSIPARVSAFAALAG